MGADEELGLKFSGTKLFDRIRLSAFDRLERRLGSSADLTGVCRMLIAEVLARWPELSEPLRSHPDLFKDVGASVVDRAYSLLARP